MDTLPLAIVPPSNASPSTFVVQQHAHPSSVIDNVSASSAAHSDGVWVAPPEQQARQQPQITPSFSHLQPQRPTSSFVGQPQTRLNGETEDKEYRSISSFFFNLDEHSHDYSHPLSQQAYSSNRMDDSQLAQSSTRSQPAPTFSSRGQARPGYPPS